jgi:hypothetical protein
MSIKWTYIKLFTIMMRRNNSPTDVKEHTKFLFWRVKREILKAFYFSSNSSEKKVCGIVEEELTSTHSQKESEILKWNGLFSLTNPFQFPQATISCIRFDTIAKRMPWEEEEEWRRLIKLSSDSKIFYYPPNNIEWDELSNRFLFFYFS